MLEIYQNYISHIPLRVYQQLLEAKVLDGLKFPGTGASVQENDRFIFFASQLKCKVDNHGWNGLTAQLHNPCFASQICSYRNLDEYLNLPGAEKYSSHIGLQPGILSGNIAFHELNSIFLHNLSQIRNIIHQMTGKHATIYGEGMYALSYDPKTITPTFINHTLKSHGLKDGLDGLVLDIAHSSLACHYINEQEKNPYTFETYLSELDVSSVRIIHTSGSYWTFQKGCTFTDFSNMDPHIRSSLINWNKFLIAFNRCPNVEKVSNEISYSNKKGNMLDALDYCKEAILTRIAVSKRSIEAILNANAYLEKYFTSPTQLPKVIQDLSHYY